jgi:hypothetical protein
MAIDHPPLEGTVAGLTCSLFSAKPYFYIGLASAKLVEIQSADLA